MLSNTAIDDVLLQLSADQALRAARLRAWREVVARMYAIDMQYCRPWAPAVGTHALTVGLAALIEPGGAGAGPGARGGIRTTRRPPGFHSGPSPPAAAWLLFAVDEEPHVTAGFRGSGSPDRLAA